MKACHKLTTVERVIGSAGFRVVVDNGWAGCRAIDNTTASHQGCADKVPSGPLSFFVHRRRQSTEEGAMCYLRSAVRAVVPTVRGSAR